MVRRVLAVLLCGTAFSGCAVHELHKDQDLIRGTLLKLYTDQIMDNLVRASNGMPIIQLDYSNASAQVTITSSVNGNDNQAVTMTNVFSLPAAGLMATRSIVTTLMGGGMSSNGNQVSLLATPVTTTNEVYDAYLEFLDPEKNPGSLRVQCDRPKPGTVHIWKEYEGKYYYVPHEYGRLFFRLALLTTAQRGKSLMAPDEFFKVQVMKVTAMEPGGQLGTQVLTLELNDKSLPTDDTGQLVLDSDKEHKPFALSGILGQPGFVQITVTDGSVPAIGDNQLDLFKTLATNPEPGRVFFVHRRPRPQTTDDLLNRVNFQLQQIQFNQVRVGGP